MIRAIILSAGVGNKVWPYGEFRQKCTLPVCNTPIVRRLAQQLVKIGIEQITIVVGHHAQQVISATADLPNVTFVTQKIPEGTATATYQAITAGSQVEQYLVLAGDVVVSTNDLQKN